MKKRIIYTDAPLEIEEAFAHSKRIPNFIDVDSLVHKDGTKPSFVAQDPKTARQNGLKKQLCIQE